MSYSSSSLVDYFLASTVEEVSIKVAICLEFVEVVVLWWVFVFLKSEMSWKVSVMGVMNIISGISELVRVVESVELVSGSLDVVLNTIAIEIIDFSLSVEILVNGDSANKSEGGSR